MYDAHLMIELIDHIDLWEPVVEASIRVADASPVTGELPLRTGELHLAVRQVQDKVARSLVPYLPLTLEIRTVMIHTEASFDAAHDALLETEGNQLDAIELI